jgi:hypothetical protein
VVNRAIDEPAIAFVERMTRQVPSKSKCKTRYREETAVFNAALKTPEVNGIAINAWHEWHSHLRMILCRRGIWLAAGQPFSLKLLTQDD